MRVSIEPPAVHEQVAESEEMRRLIGGDALDRAMFGSALLTMVLRSARDAGATSFALDVEGAGEVHDQMAEANGLTLVREILQLRRDLPLDDDLQPSPGFEVRTFDAERDAARWLEVNNRAFAWHPDQSGWTEQTLRTKQAEPWFDPHGFLLHERDGRLAGFCWTKIHHDERPQLGEIFVIGVDPDFHGEGIGRDLLIAGLRWLGDQGLRNGMLWVEADNTSALALYDRLGFERNDAHRFWRIDL